MYDHHQLFYLGMEKIILKEQEKTNAIYTLSARANTSVVVLFE
jgi:hypothetical protein